MQGSVDHDDGCVDHNFAIGLNSLSRHRAVSADHNDSCDQMKCFRAIHTPSLGTFVLMGATISLSAGEMVRETNYVTISVDSILAPQTQDVCPFAFLSVSLENFHNLQNSCSYCYF